MCHQMLNHKLVIGSPAYLPARDDSKLQLVEDMGYPLACALHVQGHSSHHHLMYQNESCDRNKPEGSYIAQGQCLPFLCHCSTGLAENQAMDCCYRLQGIASKQHERHVYASRDLAHIPSAHMPRINYNIIVQCTGDEGYLHAVLLDFDQFGHILFIWARM